MTAIPARPALLLLALAASAAATLPARAQVESREGIALQNQILELRRDLDAQRAQGGGGGAPAYASPQQPTVGGDIAATLLTRVTQLEDEVRRLRGQLDEEQNARTRQGENLAKEIGDLSFKLGGGGGGVAPLPPPLATPRFNSGEADPPPRPAPVVRRRAPETALAEGTAAYNRHDYATAQAAAREVLAGGGPRAGDAQFLLARALAGARDYQAAAVAYDDAYKRNPKGSRAQDSLVGLANTLADLNERKAACETLDKARAEFPTPRPDVRPALTAARFRAGCGA